MAMLNCIAPSMMPQQRLIPSRPAPPVPVSNYAPQPTNVNNLTTIYSSSKTNHHHDSQANGTAFLANGKQQQPHTMVASGNHHAKTLSNGGALVLQSSNAGTINARNSLQSCPSPVIVRNVPITVSTTKSNNNNNMYERNGNERQCSVNATGANELLHLQHQPQHFGGVIQSMANDKFVTQHNNALSACTPSQERRPPFISVANHLSPVVTTSQNNGPPSSNFFQHSTSGSLLPNIASTDNNKFHHFVSTDNNFVTQHQQRPPSTARSISNLNQAAYHHQQQNFVADGPNSLHPNSSSYINSARPPTLQSNRSTLKSAMSELSLRGQRKYAQKQRSTMLSDKELLQVEIMYKSRCTRVHVCRCLANLYTSPVTLTNRVRNPPTWDLTFTGVPVLLQECTDENMGTRQLSLVLAEKGTGFALWRDIVTENSDYTEVDRIFHTLTSSSQTRLVGLSFDNAFSANEFYARVRELLPDSATLVKSQRRSKSQTRSRPEYRERRNSFSAALGRSKRHYIAKTNISTPCCFQHITSIRPNDVSQKSCNGHAPSIYGSQDSNNNSRPNSVEDYAAKRSQSCIQIGPTPQDTMV